MQSMPVCRWLKGQVPIHKAHPPGEEPTAAVTAAASGAKRQRTCGLGWVCWGITRSVISSHFLFHFHFLPVVSLVTRGFWQISHGERPTPDCQSLPHSLLGEVSSAAEKSFWRTHPRVCLRQKLVS